MAVMTSAELTSQRLDVPPAGRYRISPAQSTVAIRTRHLFGLGPVRATIALRDGLIVVTSPPRASAVQARFAVPSFQSGNGARDAAVLSPRLLDAEAHPTLSFTSTELTEERGQGTQGQWTLHGDLAVRGVTRPAAVALTALEVDGATLRATARARVDRYDFGLTAYRGLAARALTIEFTVIAHREHS
jgi:polyisoprenoid-binding protein YceI